MLLLLFFLLFFHYYYRGKHFNLRIESHKFSTHIKDAQETFLRNFRNDISWNLASNTPDQNTFASLLKLGTDITNIS